MLYLCYFVSSYFCYTVDLSTDESLFFLEMRYPLFTSIWYLFWRDHWCSTTAWFSKTIHLTVSYCLYYRPGQMLNGMSYNQRRPKNYVLYFILRTTSWQLCTSNAYKPTVYKFTILLFSIHFRFSLYALQLCLCKLFMILPPPPGAHSSRVEISLTSWFKYIIKLSIC